jgi:hypothetical protein
MNALYSDRESDKHCGELIANQDAEEYFAVPSASNTMLGHLKKSPAHLQWALAHPPKSTPAMTIGSAFHACVLEGPTFVDRWGRGSKLSARTKDGKAAKIELEERYGADKILKAADYDNVLAMAGTVLQHPIASVLLTGARTEISTYWTDAESGINAKSRIDIIPPGASDYGECLVDLKSTIDASPGHMAKAIHNLGYARQGGLYLSPFEDRNRFLIIAVEKTPPWAVAVYELSPNALAKGWSEAQGLLNRWSQCVEDYDMHDLWPSYSEEITELDLPPWAL